MTAPHDNGHGEAEAVKIAEEAKREAARAVRLTKSVELALVAVAAIAALGAVGFSGWNTYRTRQFGAVIADCTTPGGKCFEANRRQSQEFRDQLRAQVDEVARCIALQLLQHRDANERSHVLNAQKHGYVYAAPPAETPPPIPADLEAACDRILKKGNP